MDEIHPAEDVPDADVELRDRLQAAGCAGPVWNQVAAVLARYGWAVMAAWLDSGIILQKCHEKGRPVTLPDDWNSQDREDLVDRAVAAGMGLFRQALLDDRWKPERGASLKTYFLGGCILAFPNALRQWQREQWRYRQAALAYAREPTVECPGAEPVDAVDALRSLTRDESVRCQAIRMLTFDGYMPAEIAEVLGMTPGAVNTALSRMRRRRGGRTP